MITNAGNGFKIGSFSGLNSLEHFGNFRYSFIKQTDFN